MVQPTRGIRNHNPGNLEYGKFAQAWHATGSDGRFAIFMTMVDGLAAMAALLIAYSNIQDGKGGKIDTVREAISRWAPANENHTAAYIALVCTVLDCNQDDEFDFRDPNFLFWMVTAIGEEENGPAAFSEYVTDFDIMAAVKIALGRA